MKVRRMTQLVLAGTLVTTMAFADESEAASKDVTKEECIDTHSRAQDLRDKGQLTRSKALFMQCAQSSCPSLVQSDCARYGEELSHLVPSVSFGARDAQSGDLPNTTVYVDDVLTTQRLDDGKTYEFDPGKHVVRYVHDGRETTLKVVLGQGEKGRVLLATFVDPTAPSKTEPPPPEKPSRSALPLVVAGVGAAAAITGGVLYGVGMGKVPSNCSVSTHDCSGPPDDPSMSRAESGVSMANMGIAIGIGGAIALVGGIVWYFAQPVGTDTRRGKIPGPFLTF